MNTVSKIFLFILIVYIPIYQLHTLILILVFTFQLKLWISLLIPKIESENNFGFIVKQKTCAALELIKNEAFDYFTSISGYFSYRGKLIRQVCILEQFLFTNAVLYLVNLKKKSMLLKVFRKFRNLVSQQSITNTFIN